MNFFKLLIIVSIVYISDIHTSSIKPRMFILIGPSGVGKSTLIAKLQQQQQFKLAYLITCTTRQKRMHEQHGKDYFFLSKEEFQQKQDLNGFLTASNIYGNWYGISYDYINQKFSENYNLITCLTGDVVEELITKLGKQNISTIFIAPPSIQELERRLRLRNTETQESLQKRLASAEHEIKERYKFDYYIINDDLSIATQELHDIIEQTIQK